ncbi:MAG: TerC family protein [Pseudomonadota bacterium]|nr:TerC family protein [Pseudomonadota bacterium]
MNLAEAWSGGSALLEIIGINLLLSGDNALVIALVMRGLPDRQRRRGIWIGTLGAVVMRVLLTLGAWKLLALPGLRLAGGVTLVWLGWRLSVPESHGSAQEGGSRSLASAVRQVIWADAVMSADNVLAVAGAAHGRLDLLLIGIATSIPLVAAGSGAIGRLLDRFPAVVTAGGGLLGWVGGELLAGDPLLARWPESWRDASAPVFALAVLLLAWQRGRRR